jgi:uncharacterized membrane protein (UPF0182 family)
VQRYQLAKYHVTDPGQFFQGNDQWEVAEDPNVSNTFQPPYRVFTGDGQWSMTSVFVPRGKSTVASFASVNSDAESDEFGQIKLLEMTDENTPAPAQVANDMEQNDEVRDKLLPYINGSTPPRYGNLLTLPVDNGLVYVEPVYAAKTTGASGYPILQFVIVYYGGDVGIGSNLKEALDDVLNLTPTDNGNGNGQNGNGNGDGQNGNGNGQNGNGPKLTLDQQIEQKLQAASDAFASADRALTSGDLQEYARLTEKARGLVNDALNLAQERDSAAPESPTSSPTSGGGG